MYLCRNGHADGAGRLFRSKVRFFFCCCHVPLHVSFQSILASSVHQSGFALLQNLLTVFLFFFLRACLRFGRGCLSKPTRFTRLLFSPSCGFLPVGSAKINCKKFSTLGHRSPAGDRAGLARYFWFTSVFGCVCETLAQQCRPAVDPEGVCMCHARVRIVAVSKRVFMNLYSALDLPS